jgi:hypothetical protein
LRVGAGVLGLNDGDLRGRRSSLQAQRQTGLPVRQRVAAPVLPRDWCPELSVVVVVRGAVVLADLPAVRCARGFQAQPARQVDQGEGAPLARVAGRVEQPLLARLVGLACSDRRPIASRRGAREVDSGTEGRAEDEHSVLSRRRLDRLEQPPLAVGPDVRVLHHTGARGLRVSLDRQAEPALHVHECVAPVLLSPRGPQLVALLVAAAAGPLGDLCARARRCAGDVQAETARVVDDLEPSGGLGVREESPALGREIGPLPRGDGVAVLGGAVYGLEDRPDFGGDGVDALGPGSRQLFSEVPPLSFGPVVLSLHDRRAGAL